MSKIIIALQLIFVLSVFSFVIFFAPSLEYPNNGEILNRQDVEFKFRNANVILVDETPDFSSPKKINLDELNISKVFFEPGKYYWKAVGLIESEVREFVVSSNVGLELDEENKTIKNVGDSKINVTKETSKGIEGLVILDVEVEYPIEAENGTKYRGEQNG